MGNHIFLSPSVYTSETDLTFITSQIGVTTLGLVGETTFGPAFQPIFMSNWGQFKSFFGGTDTTLIKDNNAPKYELPYIAKSYFSEGNQLFVTRVLGLSGFYAGLSWGITLDAALDPSTTGVTAPSTNYNPLISYTATSAGTIVTMVSTDSTVQALINNGLLTAPLSNLGNATVGQTLSVPQTFYKTGTSFIGAEFNLYVKATNFITHGTGVITGTTTGATIHYAGTSYSDVENKLVALLRSRGSVDFTTQLPTPEITGATNIGFSSTAVGSLTNPIGAFALTGTSVTQGAFTYDLSFDNTKTNYITKVLGRENSDGNTALFVEEFFPNMFKVENVAKKIRGIKQTLINYGNEFGDYLQQYTSAETPWVVSELRGNKVLKLFKFITISDGNAANEQFKISINNIDLDKKEFDVEIRPFSDTDDKPYPLETHPKCVMDKTSVNYIGRRIGTTDGVYVSKSSYVLVELDDSSNTSDAFPAGFVGYPIRDYQSNSNTSVVNPKLNYKQTYPVLGTAQRVIYLGISNTVGIDSDFFDYKGIPQTISPNVWTGLTNGFHLDVQASAVTIDNVKVVVSSGVTYSPIFKFDTGNWEFKTSNGLTGGPYEKTYGRKFTFVPYGGFDGWDIYRTRRSNTDSFSINGVAGAAGIANGQTFRNITLENGDLGINSDYYAYLKAIWTFKNPEAVNVNVFATPGIDTFDNMNLVEATIDMVERERGDALYIVTTPDTSDGATLTVNDVVNRLDGNFDSNYTCTYWPWVQIIDKDNQERLIFIPPTSDVVRNIAFTDIQSYPWFAIAGVARGSVNAVQAREKLTLAQRDVLYDNRINPIATFTDVGIKIWGNKTLQIKDTALNRINVRRLLLQARKLIAAVGVKLLFEQNDSVVRNQFLSKVNPILENIRSNRGLTDFRVVLSDDPEDYDKNQLTGQIFLKPTRALEFIQVEFVLMNTGADFTNG